MHKYLLTSRGSTNCSLLTKLGWIWYDRNPFKQKSDSVFGTLQIIMCHKQNISKKGNEENCGNLSISCL